MDSLPEPHAGESPSKQPTLTFVVQEPTAANFFNDPRVHFMRNVLAYAGRQGRRVVAAFIGTAFV